MSVNVKQVIDQMRSMQDVVVHVPGGLPTVSVDEVLPDDIVEFYSECGGADIFVDEDFGISIVKPSEFQRANPIIVGEECKYDRSYHWYIVATGGDQCVTVDLHPDRVGRCYDSFWDRHGIAGSCEIVALSFFDFLCNYLASKGHHLYWLGEGFQKLGDAYD